MYGVLAQKIVPNAFMGLFQETVSASTMILVIFVTVARSTQMRHAPLELMGQQIPVWVELHRLRGRQLVL